ncbi:MAG: Octanoyltransferase LipM [Chlamydiia bacterium]|nr:Octanoyltransferase LipM [Chlamydiia bacterium]
MWQVLESGIKSAEENMALDAKLLENLKNDDDPILHLYDWKKKSATYGYFINTKDYLNLDGAKKHELDLARRPTGGGIVFHTNDLAFSVLVPSDHKGYSENTLENYQYVNDKVIEAIKLLLEESNLTLLPGEPVPLDSSCKNFCMAKPTIYDVMLGGKKIAGAAQRKRKQGFLHQGTISIAFPKKVFLQEVLKSDTKVFEAMQSNTYSILGEDWNVSDLMEIRQNLQKQLKQAFKD